MELLFKFILNQDGRELTTSSALCQLVQHHAQHTSIDEAKEFIALAHHLMRMHLRQL